MADVAMTVEEAYERGQRDMRNRIIKQWSGWVAGDLARFQIVREGVRPRGWGIHPEAQSHTPACRAR